MAAVEVFERLSGQQQNRISLRVRRAACHDQTELLGPANNFRKDTIDRILILARPAGYQFSDLRSFFPQE